MQNGPRSGTLSLAPAHAPQNPGMNARPPQQPNNFASAMPRYPQALQARPAAAQPSAPRPSVPHQQMPRQPPAQPFQHAQGRGQGPPAGTAPAHAPPGRYAQASRAGNIPISQPRAPNTSTWAPRGPANPTGQPTGPAPQVWQQQGAPNPFQPQQRPPFSNGPLPGRPNPGAGASFHAAPAPQPAMQQ